jgi:hypothetical protein
MYSACVSFALLFNSPSALVTMTKSHNSITPLLIP